MYDELRARLLKVGGLEVVPPRFDTFEAWEVAREEYYIRKIIEDGRTWAGMAVALEPGTTNECHTNVARVHVAGRGRIVTGWALAEDGLWRSHSWLVETMAHNHERAIETTVSWLVYHGAELSAADAAQFTRDELGEDGIPKGAA